MNNQLIKTHDWMIDLDCINHMFFDKNEFIKYQLYRVDVMIANEAILWTKGRETVDMKWLLSNKSSNIVSV